MRIEGVQREYNGVQQNTTEYENEDENGECPSDFGSVLISDSAIIDCD
jgi:hypothetical protein